MVNPRDFARPWTPMGGSPPSAGAAGAPLPPGIAQPPQAPSTGAKRAMEAAFRSYHRNQAWTPSNFWIRKTR